VAQVVSFAPEHNKGANDAVRAQINYMSNKIYVITQSQIVKNFESLIEHSFSFDKMVNVRAANTFTACERECFRDGNSLFGHV